MAPKLSNFTIHDSWVTLYFKNGQTRRVKVANLSRYLKGKDLEQVQDSIRLRQKYIDTQLPRWVKAIVMVAGAVTLGYSASQSSSILDSRLLPGKTPEFQQETPADPRGLRQLPATASPAADEATGQNDRSVDGPPASGWQQTSETHPVKSSDSGREQEKNLKVPDHVLDKINKNQ